MKYIIHISKQQSSPPVCYPAAVSVHTDVFTVECLDRDPQSNKPLCTYENKLDSWQIINLCKVAGIRGICLQMLQWLHVLYLTLWFENLMVWTRLRDCFPKRSRWPAVQIIPHSLTVNTDVIFFTEWKETIINFFYPYYYHYSRVQYVIWVLGVSRTMHIFTILNILYILFHIT